MKDKRKQQVWGPDNGSISAFVCNFKNWIYLLFSIFNSSYVYFFSIFFFYIFVMFIYDFILLLLNKNVHQLQEQVKTMHLNVHMNQYSLK